MNETVDTGEIGHLDILMGTVEKGIVIQLYQTFSNNPSLQTEDPRMWQALQQYMKENK